MQQVLLETGNDRLFLGHFSGHTVWVTESNQLTLSSAPECSDNLVTDKCVSFLRFPPVPISLPARRNLQEMYKETQVLLSRRLQQNPIKTKGKKADFPVEKADGCLSVSWRRGHEEK